MLVLEIKATARADAEIEHLVSFQEEAFDRIRMQDEGVLVRQLDGESEDLAALSERQWLLEFKAKPITYLSALIGCLSQAFHSGQGHHLSDLPRCYRDLETVGPEILLSGGYGGEGDQWPWILAVVCVALMTAWFSLPSTIDTSA